jgi:hypothetical protein
MTDFIHVCQYGLGKRVHVPHDLAFQNINFSNIILEMSRRTLKKRLHSYFAKKQDICCEENVKRPVVIRQIIEKYKQIATKMKEPHQYLDYIDNDLVLFVGFKVDLIIAKNKNGIALWDEISRGSIDKKKVSLRKIKELLEDVPLYFLLSFLGYATYTEGNL